MRNRYLIILSVLLFTVSYAFSAPTLEAAKQLDKAAMEQEMLSRSITIGEWSGSNAMDEIDVPVTIGTGTTTSSIPSPYTDWFYAEISCALYTAAEIIAAGGGPGVITHIRYYVQNAKSFPARTASVHMKHTTSATLPTQTYAQAITGATLVWSTTNLTDGGTAGTWREFDIADFTWDGTSNLMVIWATHRAGYSSSTGIFRMSTVATGYHQTLAQDVTPIPTGTTLTNQTLRPNIQLEMIMAPVAPSNPIPANGATNIPTNPTLSWTNGAGTGWVDVYFDTNNPPTTLVADDLVGNSWAPSTELSPNTPYYWRIHAFNNQGNTLGPVWMFTTGAGAAPNAPSNGAITGATPTSLTGTFMDNSTNETGFPLYGSTNGVDFTYITDLPPNPGTGLVTFTMPGLNPNTRYWARVYATGAGGTSTGFAAADGWTLCYPASQIQMGTVGYTNATIVGIPDTDGNPPNTLYRVLANPGLYVMEGGSPRQATKANWANINVTGLNSGQTYNFQAVAVNGAGVEAPGPATPITTLDANVGGPDGDNYFYRTNFAPPHPHTPTFNWITHVNPTVIPTTTGWTSTDDGYYTTPIPIGFPIYWYGQTYSNMYLGSNGYITFDAGYGTIPYAGVLSTTSPGATAMFWGRDMHVGYTGPSTTIYVETFGTAPNMYTVVTFLNLAQYAYTANRMDAQIIINQDGSVIFQYNNINPAIPDPVVGIKAVNGANNMNLPFPIRPNNGNAIKFYREVNQPIFAATPSPLPFGTWYLGSTAANQTLTIANTGAGILNVTNVVASNPNVTPSWTSWSNIVNGSPVNMTVSWLPTALNETPGTLTFTHDAMNGPTTVVNLTGTAASPLTLNPTTVAYGNRATGVPATQNVNVGNLANQPINVTNVTTSDPAVVPGWTQQTIPAGGIVQLPFTWTPNNVGAFTATGTVAVGALGVSGNLNFTGTGVAATLQNPVFTPNSGEVGTTTNFTVQFASTDPNVTYVDGTITFNNIAYPLSIISGSLPGALLLGASNLPFAFVGVHNYSVVANYLYSGNPAQATIPNTGGPVGTPAQQGGPDGGGYYFRTSNAPGGPQFNWIDISASGTTAPITGDDAVGAIPLGGFTFPYYGATVTNLMASTNGNLQIGTTATTSYTNTALPTSSLNAGAICPLWDDLYIDGDRWIKYQNFGTYFVVQWRGRHISDYSGYMYYNMQVILYQNGDILFQYLNTTNPTIFSATIGIQGAQTGTLFTQYGNSSMQWPGDNFAILFTQTPPGAPDIQANPTSYNFGSVEVGSSASTDITVANVGNQTLNITNVTAPTTVTPSWTTQTIPANGSALLGLTWNPTAMGTLSGNVSITSNDPDTPTLDIPVTGNAYVAPGIPSITIVRNGSDYTISWNPVSGSVTGYRVYRHTSGYFTPPATGTLIADVPAGTTSYTDVGQTGAKYYRVTAYYNTTTASASGGTISIVRETEVGRVFVTDPNYGKPWPRSLGVNTDPQK